MKIKKIFISFVFTILIICVFILSLISFNDDFRRSSFYKFIGAYKLYKYFTIRGDVISRDFTAASKKILNYIDTSQKIAKGKNKWLEDIIEITDFVSSKIFYQFEFNNMEKVYLKIDTISDDIYKNHIWLAKALRDNDISKSINHLEKAISLSKSNEESYREILRIFYDNNSNRSLLNHYCSNFLYETQGKNQNNDNNNFFDGNNLEFSIFLNNNNELEYLKFISKLNEYKRYSFDFEEPKNIKKINIKNNFIKGSKLFVKNIVFFDSKNQKNLNIKDVKSLTYNSYILEKNIEEIIFLNNTGNDEIISLYLNNIFNNINKISFDLKIEKLLLTDMSICKDSYEN